MNRVALGAIALLVVATLTISTKAAGPTTPPPIPEKQWLPLRLPPPDFSLPLARITIL